MTKLSCFCVFVYFLLYVFVCVCVCVTSLESGRQRGGGHQRPIGLLTADCKCLDATGHKLKGTTQMDIVAANKGGEGVEGNFP